MLGQSQSELIAELRQQGIYDERVLAAMGAVPRERFVTAATLHQAYENVALPIEAGQTISQPYVVALMTQSLALTGREYVLEVGTGSGYQAAILARLAALVVTIERHPELAEVARMRLIALGALNVTSVIGDGSLGWPAAAPYDAIIVTAAAPVVPQALIDQLHQQRGRLVIPVGSPEAQELVLVTGPRDAPRFQQLGPVRFVPLIGNQGWH